MVTYSHLNVVIEATERFWVKGFTRAGVYGLGKQVWGIPKSLAVCTEPEQQGLDLQGLFDRIGKY